MPTPDNIGHAGRMANISCYDDEFPLLEGNGLYAAQTSGDGDCLFHSLSDQLYGHETCHHELRKRVVEHLRTHSAYFKAFIDVAPVRRAPRRRAAASSKVDLETHSQTEIDKAFEHRLQRMQNSGTFGDNLEIQAFAREFGVDVKIYQREYAYVICADNGSGNAGRADGDTKVVHIAYHVWEHYSSIRNRAGPHTGLPAVCIRSASPKTMTSVEEKLAKSCVLPWMEEVVIASLPHHVAPQKIREALEKSKGDMNKAISQLIDYGWDDAEEINSDLEAVCQEPEPSVDVSVVEGPLEASPQLETKKSDATPIQPKLMQTVAAERGSVAPVQVCEPTTVVIEEAVEVDADFSRVKRRKSPDGSPVSTASYDSRSVRSSSSSDSDMSERRRRKPVSPSFTPVSSPPTRRSPRIRAKVNTASVTVEEPIQVSDDPPRSRKAQRKSKRKPAAGARKRKDGIGTVQTVTVGIRELYV